MGDPGIIFEFLFRCYVPNLLMSDRAAFLVEPAHSVIYYMPTRASSRVLGQKKAIQSLHVVLVCQSIFETAME